MVFGVLFLLVFALLAAGTVAVVVGTLRKTKWGINTTANQCPRCGTPMPMIRKPANVSQAMWGGSTCATCGAELDKWGRLLSGK